MLHSAGYSFRSIITLNKLTQKATKEQYNFSYWAYDVSWEVNVFTGVTYWRSAASEVVICEVNHTLTRLLPSARTDLALCH